jgi:hypothetical protein
VADLYDCSDPDARTAPTPRGLRVGAISEERLREVVPEVTD